MNKPLFLFVGKSASGKTSVANMLESDGYTQVSSYTTRSPRYEGEVGHTFITEEEYSHLENIVASTLYNGYHYCTTLEQIKDADIYVIDVPGCKTLLDNYDKLNRDIYILYFNASVINRIRRMIDRHDSDTRIVSRLLVDEDFDWWKKIIRLDTNKFFLYQVDANKGLNEVYNVVKEFIGEVNERWLNVQ